MIETGGTEVPLSHTTQNLYTDHPAGLPNQEIENAAQEYLAQMSLEQKINQMTADSSLLSFYFGVVTRGYNRTPYHAGQDRKLGIPAISFSDGPRGVVMYNSTCFPVSMGRGASWDTDLEERIGDAIGIEARAQGANFFGGVCINLLRHPAWGRAQETYGEDPFLLGEMGAALTRGVQRHIMACAKHFALNSIENARFKVDVRVDERTLREVYLPHFRRVVTEGVASIMSAYNKVNGEWCGHHASLLRNILKEEWGFEGFVISDFLFGVRDAKAAVLGGMDIEMPAKKHFHKKLASLVQNRQVPEDILDEAVLRILRTKLRFAAIGKPQHYTPQSVVSDKHTKLAREAAQKSIVLLKNEPVFTEPLLPLDKGALKSIAVIGQLAKTKNTGDHGSSQVRPPDVVTPLDGIRAALPSGIRIRSYTGRRVETAARAARNAEVAVIIAGYRHNDEGEYMSEQFEWLYGGGDRVSLTLSAHQETLIKTVAAVNPRTIVVLIGGSAVITENWRQEVPAILVAWYPGMEGGHAIADVLFGSFNPGGKLPCSFPTSADHLPFFDRDTEAIHYDYFHGYWILDKDGHQAAFPFGFGLSYTSFAFNDLTVDKTTLSTQDTLHANVAVTNTGERLGAEVVQLYVGYPQAQIVRPVRQLKAFKRIVLTPGETQNVTLDLKISQLAYYETSQKEWIVPAEKYTISVGSSSRVQDLLSTTIEVTD
jgi:beta-glucosidase